MKNKTAETLEAVHTHTQYFTTKREEVRLLFKHISFLLQTSCKGGYNLGGGLYG